MNVVTQILENKRQEVSQLPATQRTQRTGPDFVASCKSSTPFIIAEIKPHSPAGETLLDRSQIQAVLQDYNQYAQAISVLCDQKFFHGGFDLLKEVAAQTHLPILAKEFIISTKQIHLAAQAGASAILLIPGLLEEELTLELLHEALACDLDVLIEFHGPEDLNQSLSAAIAKLDPEKILLGVNNRNLQDLKIDLKTTENFIPQLKSTFGPDYLYVSESGISQPEDALKLTQHADGLLIGTALLKPDDRPQFFNKIFS